MLIDVSSVFEHPKFIEALDGYERDGVTIKFVKEEKTKMVVEVTGLEGQAAITFVKSYLKSLKWTTAIYFTVVKHL